MPRGAAKPSQPADAERIGKLVEAALQFVPRHRAEATMRKWLESPEVRNIPPSRRAAAVIDALSLSADLLLSQPSALGSTAFDRLAKSRASDQGPDAPFLAALRMARYRLLRLEPAAGPRLRMACDAVSGEAICLPAYEFAALAAGTEMFLRLVKLPDELHCPAGLVTPLNPAAYSVARGHGAAGATGVFANARWADALFAHVVRHGTLEVPGINRPEGSSFGRDFFGDAAPESPLESLARRWAAIGDGAPDPDLLQSTRQQAGLHTVIDALVATIEARAAPQPSLATSFERLLMVMLETILRRERSGSANVVTLDEIGQQIDVGVARGHAPHGVRALFAGLRQRMVSTSMSADLGDQDLARLMQRIQGLRAKTVGQGCTEQEALAAAEKVAELLDRYGLSLGELDFKTQPCDGLGIQTTRKRAAPIDRCVPTIAEFFDCRVWVEQASGEPLRYVFFGVRADVAAAQYLYELVERAFDTETNLFRAGPVYASMAGERRAATTSFQVGLGNGICDKLRALQAARDAYRRSASGRDLVVAKAAVVDDELAKLGLSLHKRSLSGNRRVLSDAYQAGQQAAERFEYIPAIGQAA
jgi:hypothetical protein